MNIFNLSELVQLATISYVHHVHDYDDVGDMLHEWYEVHLEVPDGVVQTVQFTVAGMDTLETICVTNGWTLEPDMIRKYNNQTGQLFS